MREKAKQELLSKTLSVMEKRYVEVNNRLN
jgi:hypothetical protein